MGARHESGVWQIFLFLWHKSERKYTLRFVAQKGGYMPDVLVALETDQFKLLEEFLR